MKTAGRGTLSQITGAILFVSYDAVALEISDSVRFSVVRTVTNPVANLAPQAAPFVMRLSESNIRTNNP